MKEIGTGCLEATLTRVGGGLEATLTRVGGRLNVSIAVTCSTIPPVNVFYFLTSDGVYFRSKLGERIIIKTN